MRRNASGVIAVFTAILLGAFGFVFAEGVSVGVHGGISIPNLRGNDTDIFSRGFKSREGIYFGLSAELGLGPMASLVAQLNYTSQGGLRKGLQPITMDLPDGLPIPPGTILYADFRNETILDYLEIPVMIRLTSRGRVRFFAEAGPYAGYLVRARAQTAGTSFLYLDELGTMPIVIPPATDPLSVDLGADTNVRASLKRTNLGLTGGGGLIYPLGQGSFVLEARFQLGLTTIQKDVETSGDTQTGAVVISLGYRLPIGPRK
jgi:hypothetical protein